MMSELTLKNPRCRDSLDWPAADRRTVAHFAIVRSPDGWEQCNRATSGKQRHSPRGERVRIVTGSNDRTYIVGRLSTGRRFILPGTMRGLRWLSRVKDNHLCMQIDRVLYG